MLLCAYAIVHVGRMYYKGVITNRTQDTARRVVEDIASTIQFGSGSTLQGVDGQFESRCFGNIRYTFVRNSPLGAVPHVLWKDKNSTGSCPPVRINQPEPPDSTDGEEMLGSNMRVTRFDITDVANGLQEVSIRIAYGDSNDLFENNDPTQPCKGTNAGGQFCAVSEFKTQVKKRLP